MGPRHPPRTCTRGAVLPALAAGLLVAGPAVALDPWQPVHRYAHRAWNRETGLPSSSVQGLIQGRDGYLWLGTQDGLVRFDGTRFASFSSRNTPAIGNDDVQSLAEGPDGSLWFSTLGGGLVRLREGRFEAWTTAQGLSADSVRVLLVDRAGRLWVGTDRGLDLFADGAFEGHDLAATLGDPVVEALFEDGAGRLWVASRTGGICVFADGACQPAPLPDGVAPRQVRAFQETRDGAFWMATEGQGLLRLAGGAASWTTAGEGLPGNDVTALAEDRDGNLWVGTRRGGLARLGPGGVDVFGARDGLTQAHVTSLAEDREGNLWIGTYAGGLNRLQDALFVTYGVRDGVAEEVVLSVLQDRLGFVWLGTLQGLFRMHGEAVVPFPGEEELGAVAVTALFEDRAGALWAGSFGQGLRRHADGAWRTWDAADGLSAPYVFAVASDSEGRIWVGTQRGLDRLEGERFVPVEVPAEIGGSAVRVLHLDRAGTLWVGCDGGGLFRWTGGGFSAPLLPPGTPPNQRKVTTALEDPDGTLWFGTEGGLLRVRGETVEVLTEADGLHDDRIWRVLPDTAGDLWLSSNEGVFRLSRAAIDARLGGGPPVESLVFGRADGMVSSECNGGYLGAGARTEDGRLWFPTTRGVAVVDPAKARRVPPPAPVVIEGLTADSAEVDLFRPIDLAPGTWRVAIRFTAPSFQAPDKVLYRYRIDERGWSEPSPRGEAVYTNLDPGEHTFDVVASNGQGAWGEAPTQLRLTVLPEFWQTAWFRALVVATGLLVVGTVAWYRERRLRARQVELVALVASRTADLKRFAAEREELSLRDALTGLRNRRFLLETVRDQVGAIARRQAAQRAERRPTTADRLGLCAIDIDHFKEVNDGWGHDAGDRVLEQFSRLLQETARGEDVVVRWGGEEFLIVLHGVDEEGLVAFGQRLRRRVAARRFSLPDGRATGRTCSVGLACCPFYPEGEYGVDLEQLVALADFGLYRAKRLGRDRTVLVRHGLRSPASREEATRAFATLEAATTGGYVEVVEV